MLLRGLERATRIRDELNRRLGRAAKLLPWLSLGYGIASGVSITRDYQHSRSLLAYMGGLVAVSIALRAWGRVAARGVDALPAHRKIVRELVARNTMVSDLGTNALQWCVQYILMFCIPLLFFAKAWITGGIAVLAVGSSLWDKWYEGFSGRPWYAASMRGVCATLTMSFAFAVVFPKWLAWFYPALGAVAVLAVLPWDAALAWRRPRWPEITPVLVVGTIVYAQATMDLWIRVPLLSVWLRHPALGTGIEDRTLKLAWGDSTSTRAVKDALARGEEFCCLTPVMSPGGVEASVVHEWWLDGKMVERIKLPPIRSKGDKGAFRTYSCKKHLPGIDKATRVACRAFLDDAIYLGTVESIVEPTNSTR